jgi:hypothetical protein
MLWYIAWVIFAVLVNGENLWVVKHRRGAKLNYRVELALPRNQFVVYSKTRPGKNAVLYSNAPSSNNNTLLVTNKGCVGVNQLAPQLFLNGEGTALSSNCAVIETYEDTGNNYTAYGNIEIGTIQGSIVIPSNYNVTTKSLGLLIDSGLDEKHCFFNDNKKQTNFYMYNNAQLISATDSYHSVIAAYIKHAFSDFVDDSGHGTHVTGIAIGRTCFSHRGMAPTSRVVFMDIGMGNSGYLTLPSNLIHLFGVLNSKVSSSSWGSMTKTYDQVTYQFDYYVKYVNRYFLHLVAAGNDCPTGFISSPALLNNGVSIGTPNAAFSCESINAKIYPLIYLPGSAIISAYAEAGEGIHFQFTPKTGTSMSTPVGLGLYYYIATRYEELGITNPTNALLRATYLINSDYPSRILTSFKNDFLKDNKKWLFINDDKVIPQQNYKLCFKLPPGEDFKVVLAWIEPPAAVLVNDLDVMVKWRNKIIWGNHGATSDTVNNIEVIYVSPTEQERALTVLISDTAATQSFFSLIITSSSSLNQISCNSTCSMLEPPIECDFDEFGNAGYYTCLPNGLLDSTSCKFHECDMLPDTALVNGSCTPQNKEVNIVKNNGYYIDSFLRACREQCYIEKEGDICQCPYGVSTLPPSAPPPPPPSRSSSAVLQVNIWQINFLLFIIVI